MFFSVTCPFIALGEVYAEDEVGGLQALLPQRRRHLHAIQIIELHASTDQFNLNEKDFCFRVKIISESCSIFFFFCGSDDILIFDRNQAKKKLLQRIHGSVSAMW